MKCPVCNLILSHNHDICRKCGFDLRPHKQALGLPIIDLQASAKELRKTESSVPTTSKNISSSFSALKKFFAPQSPPPNKPVATTPMHKIQLPPVAPLPTTPPPLHTPTSNHEHTKPTQQTQDLDSWIDLESLEETANLLKSLPKSLSEKSQAPIKEKEEEQCDDLILPELSLEQPPEESLSELVHQTADEPELLDESTEQDAPLLTLESEAPNLTHDSSIPFVSPQVIEFDDNDDLLEQQLDEMIGDLTFDFEAVPVEKSSKSSGSGSGENKAELLFDDDIEVSFEVEVEESENKLVFELWKLLAEARGLDANSPPNNEVLASLEPSMRAKLISLFNITSYDSNSSESNISLVDDKVDAVSDLTLMPVEEPVEEIVPVVQNELIDESDISQEISLTDEEIFQAIGSMPIASEENNEFELDDLDDDDDDETPSDDSIKELLMGLDVSEEELASLQVLDSNSPDYFEDTKEGHKEEEAQPEEDRKSTPSVSLQMIWDEVEAELAVYSKNNVGEVEFSISDICSFQTTPQLNMYFDLTEEDLINPKNRIFTEGVSIVKGNEKAIDNKELEHVLQSVKKQVALKKYKEKIQKAFPPAYTPLVFKYCPASLWKRFCAVCVDLSLCCILAFLTFIGKFPKLHTSYSFSSIELYYLLPHVMPFIAISVTLYLTLSTLLIAGRGQSFGQKLLGIKVYGLNGKLIGFGVSALRACSQITTLFTVGLGLLPALGRYKRTLHDYMAKTVVVYKS
jgi:uncharacterized RDD family membrane protein YckC